MADRVLGRRRTERGVATVVALALVGVLLAVTLVAAVGVHVAVAAHRSAAAADLAALAAAQAADSGTDACDAATRSAVDNGAEVTACTHDGADVVVTVAVRTPAMAGLAWSLASSARAGPAGSG